jgi:hypothetical protein
VRLEELLAATWPRVQKLLGEGERLIEITDRR